MDSIRLFLYKLLWRFMGDRLREKASPPRFTYSKTNDYLECRLQKPIDDRQVMVYSYISASGLISVSLFDEKTESFTDHRTLPIRDVMESGVRLEVLKYGWHFQESNLATYLIKSFVFWYLFIHCFRRLNLLRKQLLARLNFVRPNYLELRLSILKFAMDAKFDSKKDNHFSLNDLMKYIFGAHWQYMKDNESKQGNIKIIIDALVSEGLISGAGRDGYIVSPSSIAYLEQHFRDEQRHLDSNKLKWIAIFFTIFIAWKSLIELIYYFKCIFNVGVSKELCEAYWSLLMY